jgi:hypothetical protein
MPGRADRHEDERVLTWLRLRCDGLSSPEIGARYGVTGERVRTATQRVREADAAESGEDVEEAYW